jgi:hypothetical protein
MKKVIFVLLTIGAFISSSLALAHGGVTCGIEKGQGSSSDKTKSANE